MYCITNLLYLYKKYYIMLGNFLLLYPKFTYENNPFIFSVTVENRFEKKLPILFNVSIKQWLSSTDPIVKIFTVSSTLCKIISLFSSSLKIYLLYNNFFHSS